MGTGARVFYAIGTFLAMMAVFYIIATSWVGEDAWLFGLEWIGAVGLVLATAMSFMLGVYLDFTERRMDIVPEDWEEAEIEDGAGVLSSSPPLDLAIRDGRWCLLPRVGYCLLPALAGGVQCGVPDLDNDSTEPAVRYSARKALM